MHPVGAVVTLVVAASALYRTTTGKREALTSGLWAAAFALSIIAFLAEPLNTFLREITGLGNLARLIYYFAMVISSYLIARMTYRVARIESHWPLVFTVTSIAGMIAFYCATDLHHIQKPAIDSVPGAASAWFAIFFAIGILPTHIAAIIGVLSMTHKNNIMVWLLAIYGGVGIIAPIFIVANHIGTNTVRWPISFVYLSVWIIWLISFGALALAGTISTYQTKQPAPPQSAASRLA
jgi:hypothetical protein